jgi:phosphatidylinositol dimannoside acyltransferase
VARRLPSPRALTALLPEVPRAPPVQAEAGSLALEGLFWRRVAQAAIRRGPPWFVRWSPPVVGAAIALAMPGPRRALSRQLARVRGRASRPRDGMDVGRTFANFASGVTEVLSAGSKNEIVPEAIVHGRVYVEEILASRGGVIFATTHTAGWESLGAMMAHQHDKRVMLVMRRERDEGARRLQDAMRHARGGVDIVHVGDDPLASLCLMRHLRGGGVVALQIDRVLPGMVARSASR